MTANSKELPSPITGRSGVIVAIVVAIIALIGGIITAYYLLSAPRTIQTGNARVATDLVTIHSASPGVLERFDVYEGRVIQQGDVLGWIEHGESFKSPISGVVVHTHVKQNQIVMPQQPLATVANTANIHIQANIDEIDIRSIQLGQTATVTIDTFGNRRFKGYVRNISRINKHELAGRPFFLGTSGTFRRVTNTIPIEIVILDEVDLTHFLGANARVSLRVGEDIDHAIAKEGIPSNIDPVIIATGVVEPVNRRNIYAAAAAQSAQVQRVHAKRGDRVKEGQILATLDRSIEDIETRLAIIAARTNVASAEAHLEDAKREYHAAQTDLKQKSNSQVIEAEGILHAAEITLRSLEVDYSDASRLYTAGAMARRDFDDVKDALSLAESEYQRTRTHHENAVGYQNRRLEQLRTVWTAAQATYSNAKEHMNHLLNLQAKLREQGEIRATINGTVSSVVAKVGEHATGPLFTIETLDEVRISATVREYDLPKIYQGMDVTVTATATGKEQHRGTITHISPSAVSDVPVVTFRIEVSMESNSVLRPGMSAKIMIDTP